MLRTQRVLFPRSTTTATTRRSFFNLADSIRNASIKRYNEKKILKYDLYILLFFVCLILLTIFFFHSFTQQQVYEVVSNVDEYRHFIPFCNHSRVYSTIPKGQNKHVMQAELGIGFKLFEEKYMSTVTCHQPHKVQVRKSHYVKCTSIDSSFLSL